MTAFSFDDLREAQRLVASLPPLPDAFLRDREHMAWLAHLTEATGRRPFYESATLARLYGGIPIFLDPAVPPNVLELRHPDGHVDRIDLNEYKGRS